ncbi:MAG: zinc ribbon domain-containing protein [Holosporales bacterium]|nr:zinc ribbon domain-containing protein [Holosporales bacterium]
MPSIVVFATYAYNHGLRYRYYACSNHIRCKSCTSIFKTVPAEDVEQKVIGEVLRILKSPEVVMKINNLAEQQNEIEKVELFGALKNLRESWGYLYPAEKMANLTTNLPQASKTSSMRLTNQTPHNPAALSGWPKWDSLPPCPAATTNGDDFFEFSHLRLSCRSGTCHQNSKKVKKIVNFWIFSSNRLKKYFLQN